MVAALTTAAVSQPRGHWPSWRSRGLTVWRFKRHVRGDWGDLDEQDKQANDKALQDGSRILSAYGKGETKLWIITEADRSATTILRPDEY